MLRRNRLWQVLAAVGAACLIGYVLTAPRGVSPKTVRFGGVLLYVGIAAFLAGAVLRWRGRGGRR